MTTIITTTIEHENPLGNEDKENIRAETEQAARDAVPDSANASSIESVISQG